MKTIYLKNTILSACFSLCLFSCEKEEIPYFESEHNAVRFTKTNDYDIESKIFKGGFSFLDLPLNISYGEYTFPLTLIGNISSENRVVNYEIIEEETTAPAESYEIIEAIIPSNNINGYINIKLFNNDEIKNGASYKLCLQLKKSESLEVGPQEYIKATLNWDSNIIAPKPNERYLWMTYNSLIASSLPYTSNSSKVYSSNALKTIVTALDWDNWDDMKAHPDRPQQSSRYTYKYLANFQLLLYDQSYKAYAAKLNDYLEKYKNDHPDTPLVHNDGMLKGQEIKARKY